MKKIITLSVSMAVFAFVLFTGVYSYAEDINNSVDNSEPSTIGTPTSTTPDTQAPSLDIIDSIVSDINLGSSTSSTSTEIEAVATDSQVNILDTQTSISTIAPTTTIEIYNITDLENAINNQADGQTWNIHAGQYGVGPNSVITAGGQTGWYFPITANNITINGTGADQATIYGTGYTANGNWATQDLVAIFGNNVTINGITFMPKIEPNKAIEILGNDVTIKNVIITPNTLTNQSDYDSLIDPQDRIDDKQWGGSLYFNHAGNHTIENVTINNAGISFRYSPSGTHISFNNVNIIDTTNVDGINGYRYSSGFNDSSNSITGNINVIYHVNDTLNNLTDVLANIKDGDTLEIDSDITNASSTGQQINITKSITINGNNHTIRPAFTKTDNSNNSGLAILVNNVKINNLTIDGASSTNLHGINIYQAQGVELNNVTVKNNSHTGININSSKVLATNISTANNGWHGIDVDKTGASLEIKGISNHSEIAGIPYIYVDNTNIGQVTDNNNNYVYIDNYLFSGDRAYFLNRVPSFLNFSNVTDSSLTLNWSSSSNVAYYNIYQDNNLIATTTNSSYVLSGLSSNTNYTFSVNANSIIGMHTITSSKITNSTSTLAVVNNNSGVSLGGGVIYPSSFYNSNVQTVSTTGTVGKVLGATAFQFTKYMRLGSQGDEVLALQKFLNNKGYTVSTSGAGSLGNETKFFGLKTKAALVKYQEDNTEILKNAGITAGTGNFLIYSKAFVNNILLDDATTSRILAGE